MGGALGFYGTGRPCRDDMGWPMMSLADGSGAPGRIIWKQAVDSAQVGWSYRTILRGS